MTLTGEDAPSQTGSNKPCSGQAIYENVASLALLDSLAAEPRR
jgi:hypothetical protein